VDRSIEGLGVRPFSARSLVLSVLLGLPDPRLRRSAAFRLADVFGIAPGAMRTALSRLVGSGDLTVDDQGYELTGRLLERKRAQDTGRRAPRATWDGSWWVVLVTVANRDVRARREFRTHMINARMGELRPECWLRPSNIDDPVGLSDLDGVVVVRGALAGLDAAAMARSVWDLDTIAARCRWLLARLGAPPRTVTALPDAMLVSAAVVRFLREEPLLPAALTPDRWPVDELRRVYREYDRTFGRVLRSVIEP
jgi:phenylacetic acid degradation operon negative regulatory protein